MNTPINTAITEADVASFSAQKNAAIRAALRNEGPFSIEPDLFIVGGAEPFRITGYIGQTYTNVAGGGQTIAEALEAFRADLAKKRPSPANLRAKAAELEAEAAKLEAAA